MCRPYIPLHSRYYKQPETEGGCWLWESTVNSQGYGQFRLKGSTAVTLAHRAVYEDLVETIPNGLQLDHLCKRKRCVNPEHLEIVTCTTNIRRNSNTKLSMDEARLVRELYSKGMQQRHIAAQFDVSQRLVWNIIHYEGWKEGKELSYV